jgi:hypothetical protein
MASCSQIQERSNDGWDKEIVINEVTQMFDNYHNDIEAEGLTAEFKYLDNSDDFFWVPPGYNSTLSYDSVRLILEKNAVAFTEIKFSWETLIVLPLTDQIATYSGIVTGAMRDTAGVESPVRIIESGTVIKRNDGWKLLCGQSASLAQ